MDQEASHKAEELERRSERLRLRIPIEVKGSDAEGKPFRESTFTLVVGRHGARISLRNFPLPGDRVIITDLQNKISCPFRVIGRTGKSGGESPEWGVECLDPQINFWGIYFPPKLDVPAGQESIDVLLECVGCHFQELAQLTSDEYDTLITDTALSRDCAQCNTTTEWMFGIPEAERKDVAVTFNLSLPSL